MLKIMTICHAQNLWKLAQSCKQLHLLPYSVDFKAPQESIEQDST